MCTLHTPCSSSPPVWQHWRAAVPAGHWMWQWSWWVSPGYRWRAGSVGCSGTSPGTVWGKEHNCHKNPWHSLTHVCKIFSHTATIIKKLLSNWPNHWHWRNMLSHDGIQEVFANDTAIFRWREIHYIVKCITVDSLYLCCNIREYL